MEVNHFNPAPEKESSDYLAVKAIEQMQKTEREKQMNVNEGEKEVLIKDSEKLQKQGWRVIAVYVKDDGKKYHKLEKVEDEK